MTRTSNTGNRDSDTRNTRSSQATPPRARNGVIPTSNAQTTTRPTSLKQPKTGASARGHWDGVIAPEHERCRIERHTWQHYTVEKSGVWLDITKKCRVCHAAYQTYRLNVRTGASTPKHISYDRDSGYVQVGIGKMPAGFRSRLLLKVELAAIADAGFTVDVKPTARRTDATTTSTKDKVTPITGSGSKKGKSLFQAVS